MLKRLSGLGGRVLRLVLRLGQAQLMSEVRLLLKRGLEWGILLESLLGGLFLVGGIGRGGGPGLGPCRRQSLGLRSLYTRNFSIIDGLRL